MIRPSFRRALRRIGARIRRTSTAPSPPGPPPRALSEEEAQALAIGQHVLAYQRETLARIGEALMPISDSSWKLVSSLKPDSPYFKAPGRALFEAELRITGDLLRDIGRHRVAGAIVEFGVFRGDWLDHLHSLMEEAGVQRQIWGFDSFQGLSAPSEECDDAYWKEGMFAAGLEEVRQRIRADERPAFRLIPGFFAESLVGEAAGELGPVCLARIDCDIYQPTRECLAYLSHRLSHGSVLVFDDWSHRLDKGETRAFFEWAPTVPHLEFAFLFLGIWDHLVLRVWHRGQPRWAGITP